MTDVTIARLDDIEDGTAISVPVEGHVLCVVRLGQDVYVIGDTCTHQDVSLAEGEVDPDTCHIECWKHGSQFSLETGEPDVLPATKPVPVYDARVVDGEVVVSLTDGGAD